MFKILFGKRAINFPRGTLHVLCEHITFHLEAKKKLVTCADFRKFVVPAGDSLVARIKIMSKPCGDRTKSISLPQQNLETYRLGIARQMAGTNNVLD